jgi:class 3 adenylate cyclase
MSDQLDTGVVTLMFTDVEGSTDLTHRLGDEVARRTIEEHRRIVRAKLAEHDGREIDSIGDGFMGRECVTVPAPRLTRGPKES